MFALCSERKAHQLRRHKIQFRQFSDVSTNRSVCKAKKKGYFKSEYLGDGLTKSCKTLDYDYLDYYLLFQLKIKLGPISLHLTFNYIKQVGSKLNNLQNCRHFFNATLNSSQFSQGNVPLLCRENVCATDLYDINQNLQT